MSSIAKDGEKLNFMQKSSDYAVDINMSEKVQENYLKKICYQAQALQSHCHIHLRPMYLNL